MKHKELADLMWILDQVARYSHIGMLMLSSDLTTAEQKVCLGCFLGNKPDFWAEAKRSPHSRQVHF